MTDDDTPPPLWPLLLALAAFAAPIVVAVIALTQAAYR